MTNLTSYSTTTSLRYSHISKQQHVEYQPNVAETLRKSPFVHIDDMQHNSCFLLNKGGEIAGLLVVAVLTMKLEPSPTSIESLTLTAKLANL